MTLTKANGQHLAIIMVSLCALIGLWAVMSVLIDNPRTLPTPWTVAQIIGKEFASGKLMMHLWPTVIRVAIAFFLAMVIGSALGLLLGMMPRVNRWVDPWVVVFLNLPALVVIVLCYLWIGLNEVAAIIAVSFNKTASVLVTIREGARAMDPAISEMAKVYRMGPIARLRHVLIPQLVPFVSSAARNGLAIIWKLVLVVEFLGRSEGIGFQIHLYFQLFEVGHVMAYSLTFIALMLLIEYLVVQPFEARANFWR